MTMTNTVLTRNCEQSANERLHACYAAFRTKRCVKCGICCRWYQNWRYRLLWL